MVTRRGPELHYPESADGTQHRHRVGFVKTIIVTSCEWWPCPSPSSSSGGPAPSFSCTRVLTSNKHALKGLQGLTSVSRPWTPECIRRNILVSIYGFHSHAPAMPCHVSEATRQLLKDLSFKDYVKQKHSQHREKDSFRPGLVVKRPLSHSCISLK